MDSESSASFSEQIAIKSDTSAPRGHLHVCNCIGCCRKCNSCRTAAWHTPAYCGLLQQQAKDREALVEEQRLKWLTESQRLS